ncbi:hypothetical protein SESBI_03062 [Sesbania bispinosa]|nr:hypothetical protein SESBI_03062 [Sesbania bispinosa]
MAGKAMWGCWRQLRDEHWWKKNSTRWWDDHQSKELVGVLTYQGRKDLME